MGVDVSEDVCWICLGGQEEGALVAPCRCPRLLHASCLARWQLRRLSGQEGTRCRFCDTELPPWNSAAPAEPAAAVALVSIHVAGEVHQVCLPPGAAGAAAFKQQVEAITGTPFNDEMCSVSFVCRDPFDAESTVTLQGIGQFDDAMRCALISASERSGTTTRTSSSAAVDCDAIAAGIAGGSSGGVAGVETRARGDLGMIGQAAWGSAPHGGWYHEHSHQDSGQQGQQQGGGAGGPRGGGGVIEGDAYYLMAAEQYEAARGRLEAGVYGASSSQGRGGGGRGGALGALWARGQRYWRRAFAACVAPAQALHADEGWPPRC